MIPAVKPAILSTSEGDNAEPGFPDMAVCLLRLQTSIIWFAVGERREITMRMVYLQTRFTGVYQHQRSSLQWGK
jgi:hypothetical protein